VSLVNIQAGENKEQGKCEVKWLNKKVYKAEVVVLG